MRARVSENPTPIGLTLFVLHSDRFPFMTLEKQAIKNDEL